jgi:hypothetical protein
MMRQGIYERISQRLLKGLPKAKRHCRVWEGRLSCGTKSLHRTRSACRYRLFWRIKDIRTIIAKNEITLDRDVD